MVVSMFSRLTGDKALKTPSGANYYDVVRPGIAPPPPVFAVVWTLLLLLFGAGGVAMILPWIERGVAKDDPEETARLAVGVSLYVAILAMLYAWMPVFANKEMPRGAAYLLIAMVVLMAPLLFIAGRTSWVAATLMAPLFGWLLVALVMNSESVWRWIKYNKQDVTSKVATTLAKVMTVQPGKTIDLDEGAVSGARRHEEDGHEGHQGDVQQMQPMQQMHPMQPMHPVPAAPNMIPGEGGVQQKIRRQAQAM
jgi:benzodiazapine receptor